MYCSGSASNNRLWNGAVLIFYHAHQDEHECIVYFIHKKHDILLYFG